MFLSVNAGILTYMRRPVERLARKKYSKDNTAFDGFSLELELCRALRNPFKKCLHRIVCPFHV